MGLHSLSITTYSCHKEGSIRVRISSKVMHKTITNILFISVLRHSPSMSDIFTSIFSCASTVQVSSINSRATVGDDDSSFVNVPLCFLMSSNVIPFYSPVSFLFQEYQGLQAPPPFYYVVILAAYIGAKASQSWSFCSSSEISVVILF